VQALQPQKVAQHYSAINPISSIEDAQKVELLQLMDVYVRAKDPRIVDVFASISSEYDEILLANTEGQLVTDARPMVRLNVTVIALQNGTRERGYAGGGGRQDLSFLWNKSFWQQFCDQAVSQALTNLEAVPAVAGEMDVVLGAGWPGILLHEAVGHGLEGDHTRKKLSAFSDMMGKRVAAKGCTVVDDGTIADTRGALNVDDEGTPTQCTTLIEDGVLTGFMYDKLNAKLAGTTSTGNGRRESYAHMPIPRMTNTHMHGGTHTPEDVISSVKNGLYATNFGGGQVDITSGKFVFVANEAYRIENGKITQPVKGATIIGDGPTALTQIKMIANDSRLDPGVGVCGKDGQSVPVGVGQPTLRINGLTVGGSA
jgi:TldD protein